MLRQIYKTKRAVFARLYPTLYVFKDGSTINFRYPEPRQIIRQPVTYEEDRVGWTSRRRQKINTDVVIEETEVAFDPKKYIRSRNK